MPTDDHDPEMPTNEQWRSILIRARKEHGMTQGELGARVGVSQAMISKIETGESGGSGVILAICRVLSIPEPQHFATDDQKHWYELGHVLRRHPDQYQAALAVLEQMAKLVEPQIDAEPAHPERRK